MHARSSVQFSKSIQEIDNDTVYIEVGPQPILSHLVKRIKQSTTLSSSSSKNNFKNFLNSVGYLYENGFKINWNTQKTIKIIKNN